jgi:hypothetical protein
MSATYLDSAGHDPRNMRTIGDNLVEDRIESADPAMLAFNSAEFHPRSIPRTSDANANRSLRWSDAWESLELK